MLYLVGSVLATFVVVLGLSNLGGWLAVKMLPGQPAGTSVPISGLAQIHWIGVLFSLPAVGLLIAIACSLAGVPVARWVIRLLAGVIIAECVVWRAMREFSAGNPVGDVLPILSTPMVMLLATMVVVPPTRFGDDGRSHYLLRQCGLFCAFVTASVFAVLSLDAVIFDRMPLWQRLGELSLQLRSMPVQSIAPVLMLAGCVWMVFRPSRACGWMMAISFAAIVFSYVNVLRLPYQGNWRGWLVMMFAASEHLLTLLPVLLLPWTVPDDSSLSEAMPSDAP